LKPINVIGDSIDKATHRMNKARLSLSHRNKLTDTARFKRAGHQKYIAFGVGGISKACVVAIDE